MNKIWIAGLILVLAVISAGCVSPQDEPTQYTDKDGNIFIGDESEGSILFTDGTSTIWSTDDAGNIRYTTNDPDGTVIKYYTTPDGETVLEV
ncbi:MAG TPA: hypothetical protein VJY43_06770 [Methanocorpusculum sp.]|nr:hypothetical protein [Methanocorpusculum sp.]